MKFYETKNDIKLGFQKVFPDCPAEFSSSDIKDILI